MLYCIMVTLDLLLLAVPSLSGTVANIHKALSSLYCVHRAASSRSGTLYVDSYQAPGTSYILVPTFKERERVRE